jgi:hypothetical protein
MPLPYIFLKLLAYKAEEAGCRLEILDTRTAKPSRRDPLTLVARKKTLDERMCCPAGEPSDATTGQRL